ncbi:J domain-containing protein [Sphingomonas sp.]|uniref:J domain-containing protein n=1 Tax=Sphingomonas sp. TaxID=28214 RepID=UPI003AFFACFE
MKLLLLVAALLALWYYFRPKPKAAPADRELTDARAVLGLGPDADADAIRGAHRRLVAGVHPDRGGSSELTRRVNAARDTLLRRLD